MYILADEVDPDLPEGSASPAGQGAGEVLTLKELASRLGLHYQTVLKLVQSGKIEAARIGGQWRITREEYQRFKKEGNRRAVSG